MKYKYRFKIVAEPQWLIASNTKMQELDFDLQCVIENYIEFLCDRDDLTTEIFWPIMERVFEEGGGKLYHIDGGRIS
jgi:hypothetical protein